VGSERNTVTFEAYYWEAYNEIVRPHRIDWYLINRWMKTLGPTGFAIVKALRALCYFNPKEGTLRNQIEIDLDALAETVGVSTRTLIREFKDNNALACFVAKQTQYVVSGSRAKKTNSRYFVCMDDPIHPDDMETYERLRSEPKQSHQGPPQKTVVHKCQSVTYEDPYKCQSVTYQGQIVREAGQIVQGDGQSVTYLPTEISSSSLPLETLGTAAPSPSHKCVPPKGEEETVAPLAATWNQTLDLLAGRVNKPTLEAHLRPLVLDSVDEDGTVLLLAPHASTRDWIEKRHLPAVTEALGHVLGHTVTVRLRLAKELPREIAAGPGAGSSAS
jgi:hypothetical protein